MTTTALKIGDRLTHRVGGWGEVIEVSEGEVHFWWFSGQRSQHTPERLHELGFLRGDGTPILAQPETESSSTSSTETVPENPTILKESKPELIDKLTTNHPNKPSKKNRGSRIEYKYIRRGDKFYGPYKYLRYESNGKSRSVYLGKDNAIIP